MPICRCCLENVCHLFRPHCIDPSGAATRGPIQYKDVVLLYLYRKSHCGDKTVVRSSYLHSGISYTGKTFLYIFFILNQGPEYWIRAQNITEEQGQQSTPWLLMPWLLESPGHECRGFHSITSIILMFTVQEWWKAQIYFHIYCNKNSL